MLSGGPNLPKVSLSIAAVQLPLTMSAADVDDTVVSHTDMQEKQSNIPKVNNGETLVKESAETKSIRIKKRKFVLMMSYCGQGYFGMQIQKSGLETIEAELLEALLKNKYIDQDEYHRPQSFQFQRAARTDKNVSAARQTVSLKLPETLDIVKLNEMLPPAIRVMGLKRVTAGFDSKIQCSARTYAYMTPTFAFAPIEANVTEGYRITPDVLENVRQMLKYYVGTKNYFNFTSGKKHGDPSAHRHIMSFECGDPFVKDGLEYVVLRVKGQSFMLHQIRKMVGLCTAIQRGFAHENILESAFGKLRIDVPKAPGLGLMLEQAHYDRYNEKFGSTHEPLTWDEVKTEVEKFCNEFIYPVVTETENKEKSMWNWLATLPFHTYAVRPHDDNVSKRSEIGNAAELAAHEGAMRDGSVDEDDEVEQEESEPKRRKVQEQS